MDSEMQLNERWQSFIHFLAAKGMRVTNQRKAIFDAAEEQQDHFTVEDLLVRAREIDTSVSRATVYRAIPILQESSVIREVDVGKEFKYYVTERTPDTFKAQVICEDCDKIFEVDAPFMEWYGKTVSDKLGLEVCSQRLQVHAKCPTPGRSPHCGKFVSAS